MLKPKEIEVVDIDGKERKFTISRMPATIGMEVLYKLPISAMPKIGDFDSLKGVRDDIFKYVYVETEGGPVALSTSTLVDNHTNDAETALKVMGEMLQHNYSFFQKGTISAFFDNIAAKVPSMAQKILTQLSPALSKQSKRRSKS